MKADLDRLAAAHGILRSYQAIGGELAQAPDDAVEALLKVLGVETQSKPTPRPMENWPPLPEAPKDVACYFPDFLREERAWGIACQLYSLRSGRNWGIGDFDDLVRLGERAAQFGADFIGVNPLHALFLAEPERASPFSPSHRNFLNPLYIAVDHVEGYRPTEDRDEAKLDALAGGDLVDYRAVVAHKLATLRKIFERGPLDGSFATYLEEMGAPLRRFALFEALSFHMKQDGFGAGWTSWPEPYHDPDGESVQQFARDHEADLDFHMWLQWIADRQLGWAARRLREAGMRIGIYLDLAVGTAPDGAATWSDRSLTVVGAEIGAPPDMFNPGGQSWGLAPMSPAEMTERDFQPVHSAYETILRHAGALRIDHAMSLYRLFWIPSGFTPAGGAYVLYPMSDIVRVLAEVSQHNNTLIIGEDLGVVPEGFRREMERANMLGYRVFYFERDEDGFTPPTKWPSLALACVGSHDTPTLAGWWTERDIALRRAIGLYDGPAAEEQRQIRCREKAEILATLRKDASEVGEAFDFAVAAGLYRLVASTPSCLMAVQMEDLLGLGDQPNIPGTVDEHPNWRRRMPVTIDELDEVPVLPSVVSAVSQERPRRQ